MYVKNRVLTNPNEIADTFNEFFTSSADQLVSTIPQVTADPLQFTKTILNAFLYFETDFEEVKNVYFLLRQRDLN